MAAPVIPPALRGLLDAGGQLARRSAASRVALARMAGLVEPAMLPADVRRSAARVLDAAREEACRPLDPRAVEKALRAAWGRAPGKVLDELDPAPIAIGAAAQVHRGVHDGEPVAVKVLRPGLDAVVRNDLVLLDALAGPLRGVFGALDVGAILRYVRAMALEELDLEAEGDAQRRVARALRRDAGAPLAVPAVVADVTRPEVLVSALVDAPTLADAAPADPREVAVALLRAHLRLPRAAGLALTDPRPNHVLLPAGGEVTLLGAGAAQPVDRDRLAIALEALRALREDDPGAFAAVVVGRLHLLAGEEDARRAHAILRAVLGPLVAGPALLDAAALAGVAERAAGHTAELLGLAARVTPVPEDLAVARGLGQLAAVLARLELTEDWAATALAEAA